MEHIEATTTTDTNTLAHRMAEGRMPVSEGLRAGMQLAEALRKLHDAGQVHGALTPDSVAFAGGAVSLLPPAENRDGAITPYTAPEVLQGRPADARGDVFSFGAILFEMLTGRRAFEGESRATLSANLTSAAVPSSGSPAVDRLLGPCLAKNPEQRIARMQKVLMELKMLSVAARRAEATAPAVRREVVEPKAMRAEMQDLEQRMEARFVARLQAQDRTMAEIQQTASDAVGVLKGQLIALGTEITETRSSGAEMHRAANEVVGSLKDQLTALGAELAENRGASTEMHRIAADAMGALKGQLTALSGELADTRVKLTRPEGELDALAERILARVDNGFETASEHIARIEASMEELRQHTGQFERSVAADLADVEQAMKVQAASIESARSAMAQTDDLVERVVEALESLQTAVLDQGDNAGGDRPGNFAVN